MANKILKTLNFGTGDVYTLQPNWENVDNRPTKLTDFTNDLEIVSSDAINTRISEHNVSTAAHADIRELITGLSSRLNALADSDDTTLDQLSEIVAYIKDNRDLIDGITTSKVSTSDIITTLDSTSDVKVLAASQGKALKDLIDAVQGALDTEEEALTTHKADTVAHVTATERTAWNAKADEADLEAHTGNTTVHITAAERTAWNAKASAAVATVDTDGLMSSEDKAKLDGVAANANNYVHPATHSASVITQDEEHRFVSDTEKEAWNAKADATALTAHTGNTTVHITAAERTAWNAKSEVSSFSITDDGAGAVTIALV